MADTGFPRGTASIAGIIRAPLKGGKFVPQDPLARDALLRFNRQLLSYCQTAEWGMQTIQGSFGRLHVPLPIASDKSRRRETVTEKGLPSRVTREDVAVALRTGLTY